MPSNPIAIPFVSDSDPQHVHVTLAVSPQASSVIQERIRRISTSSQKVRVPKVLHPIENGDMRILLLENISLDAVKAFEANGWKVDHHKKAMNEEDLVQKIGKYHAIGIRSKTKITERVIKAASKVCETLP
jgi:D-3-phosphoglycerate dehydrogenase